MSKDAVVDIDGDGEDTGLLSNEFEMSELPPRVQEEPPIKCLCFNIASFSPLLQVAILSVGVFFFFILNGFVEEFVFARLPDFKFGWYLTFYELLCFAGFAVMERAVKGERVLSHQSALHRHGIVAVAMTASRGLTNVSLQYLNYPTQVVFKSMKLITVMIGSVVMLGKRYHYLEYLSSALLVTAAIFFSLGDSETKGPDNSSTGIAIVLLSLVADSLHSNSQEAVLRTHGASVLETMLYTNFFAACCTLAYVTVSGELFPALAYCRENPLSYALFVMRAFVVYCGVQCFVVLIKRFDVVLATTITTVRKILTVLLSFVLFPKPLTIKYLYGVLIFCAGLSVGMYHDRKTKRRK